jgi:putative two-component system response regulator
VTDGGRTLRVLCLEDSPLDAELAVEALAQADYDLDVSVAPDRRQFEELLAGGPYDVILADFALPGFDAHTALGLARAACPATPFICVSGTIGEEATVELLKQGADDCVLKDKLARLPFAVQRAIEDRAHARTLAESAARLRRTVEGAVEAMGSMIAARDPYTAGHEKRVTALAVAIAHEMGCDEARSEGLRLAGLVHDVGKLTVPAEILNKPCHLTPIEFELIKCHVQSAYEILASIDFEYPVAEIVAQHHERVDGSGYPAGLKGEEMLPQARILAVADVVEAMASHRPYRAALGIEAALAEVHEGAGTRYDADVVTACERLFSRGFVLEAP